MGKYLRKKVLNTMPLELINKQKVLYVCPLAHLTGHPPFECTKESRILKEHDIDVELLTFCGVHEGYPIEVKHRKIIKDNKIFEKLRENFIGQWVLRIFEYSITILVAMVIAGDRTLYLRDAEPFPHIVHILNVLFRKKWVISSTGGLYTTGEGVSKLYKIIFQFSMVNWRGWYRLSRNNIRYSVQNSNVKNMMSKLFGDNIAVVPLGHRFQTKIEKEVARETLNISNDVLVLLVLGANHSGKDSEVVFKALREVENVVLIHASPTVHSMADHPLNYARKYNVLSKIIMIDRQIGNEEKKLLFGVADWSILSYKKIFSSTTSMLWESLAYDVPVIASTGNELERLVEYWNVGLLFQASDDKSLSRTMERAKNKELLLNTKNNRDDFIKYYSEDMWYERTMRLIK